FFLLHQEYTSHWIVGKDVTLTCNYDAQHYGRLPVCWGRAAIPNSGCANEVIKSDGTSVVSRLSERYLLMGNLGRGDVSLTIRQVQESDSGIYGCRVEIPGWFNDQKHHLKLTVEAVHTTSTVTTIQSTSTAATRQDTTSFTSGTVCDI
uniref:Ig-like domain-containing protein n=1 Tax=Seriola dumerili TaxID=41447 RepID=A0A3B4TLL5_SERDU